MCVYVYTSIVFGILPVFLHWNVIFVRWGQEFLLSFLYSDSLCLAYASTQWVFIETMNKWTNEGAGQIPTFTLILTLLIYFRLANDSAHQFLVFQDFEKALQLNTEICLSTNSFLIVVATVSNSTRVHLNSSGIFL